jgi:hypothetical protein
VRGSTSGLGRIYRAKLYLPAGSTGVSSPQAAPAAVAELIATPNPFRERAEIRLADGSSPARGATVQIVDAAGRGVRRLALGSPGAASPHVVWDGRDEGGERVAAGVYYAQLVGGATTAQSAGTLGTAGSVAAAPVALVRLP